jgi:hypothetical protein
MEYGTELMLTLGTTFFFGFISFLALDGTIMACAGTLWS